jgi:hypothetical protein
MPSWYRGTRLEFLGSPTEEIVGKLHGSANRENWSIETEQSKEWAASIGLLRDSLSESRVEQLDFFRQALLDPSTEDIRDVVLEYDFRRRGLRIDGLLFAPGIIFVVEFKRGKLGSGERDQVMNYCVNLVEFHEMTQQSKVKLVPLLVSRKVEYSPNYEDIGWHQDWPQILDHVIQCGGDSLGEVIGELLDRLGLDSTVIVDAGEWDNSPFHPSSTIIDAALSLYGDHTVSAIEKHAVPAKAIDDCVDEAVKRIRQARTEGENHLIMISGAPGAGKTLVGLNLAFHSEFREDALFVTGNAPLVDVLRGSLERSYRGLSYRGRALAGYSKEGVDFVKKNTTFKIAKAHQFLSRNKSQKIQASTDGSILIFDEAQRTYKKGKRVIDHYLKKHEAYLIIEQMKERRGSAVIVLLIGQNQHINAGERGAVAWFEAAEEYGWPFSVCDETLMLPELEGGRDWGSHNLRRTIEHGHLSHSMRFYRNEGIERWAHFVMENDPEGANAEAKRMEANDTKVLLTRDMKEAKKWARSHRIGEERAGLISSAKGGRLAAEGIFVNAETDIVNWMLAPSDDVRSSNMLEGVQNQFRIQGLEIDYSIVCWDADLRRENDDWACYNVVGGGWQKRPSEFEVRKNSYRVLLTRSRKGMVVFVPQGDLEGIDKTRDPTYYDSIYNYLKSCGAKTLSDS